MTDHPRSRYYPQHADYQRSKLVHRPFVMAVYEPCYRSDALNTDTFGLREQYNFQGEFIDIGKIRDQANACNLLLGGSTALGVDASSDKTTIAFHLNESDTPCVNLGITAATTQQELILFLSLKPYLPPIRNVILLSGINEVAMAALPEIADYDPYGAVFGEKRMLEQSLAQYWEATRNRSFAGRMAAHRLLNVVADRSRLFRGLLRLLPLRLLPTGDHSAGGAPAAFCFPDRLERAFGYIRNSLETWACLQIARGLRVHYVLQPVMHWTEKPLTPRERELFEADVSIVPSMNTYTNQETYWHVMERISEACKLAGIRFHDANRWFSAAEFADADLFTDVCHLTDAGNCALAGLMRRELEWNH